MDFDFSPAQYELRDEVRRFLERECRPGVVRLFSGLTLLWAGVHLLSAATTFSLLVLLSTPTFVAVRSFVSLAITVSAVVLTVSWSIRTARAEDLVFARVAR